MRELERLDQQTREERAHQNEQTLIETRRGCYVALNTAARIYQTELTNYIYALTAEDVPEDQRQRVEESRLDHRARHAEAQMILPDPVLDRAGAVNRNLGQLYGILKRIDSGAAGSADTLTEAETRRQMSWDLLAEMRAEMRRDLGVAP
jgi:hypothetical protein